MVGLIWTNLEDLDFAEDFVVDGDWGILDIDGRPHSHSLRRSSSGKALQCKAEGLFIAENTHSFYRFPFGAGNLDSSSLMSPLMTSAPLRQARGKPHTHPTPETCHQ